MQESDISPATSELTQTTPIGVALRGVCMGLAELVPGISGGTIAFVTGIYSELVTALASFGPQSIGLLRHPQAFWQQHNLGFLLSFLFLACISSYFSSGLWSSATSGVSRFLLFFLLS